MANTKVSGDLIKAGSITQAHLHSSHGITTSHLTEGDKLFFTNARVDSRIGSLSSSNLSEGTNLYYTNARARAAISVSGNALSYNSSTGVITSNFEESPTFSGNVIVNGSGSSGNAINITRGSDGTTALRVQNTGEVVTQANYFYASGPGVSMYVQNTAVFRGSILNDGSNADVRIADGLTVDNNLAVIGGDITLGGTGRIQGIDTVSANTDAANKLYVDNQVAGIVDSAPSTLDTLNELAAALGDDENFSTTITNSIATKMPLAGGTLTGFIQLGANQLRFDQSGTRSWTLSASGGNLNINSGDSVGNVAISSGLTVEDEVIAPRFNVDNTNNYIDTISNYLSFKSGGNEMTFGGATAMYINYRAALSGTPTHWIWNAGSSTTFAKFTIGELDAKSNSSFAGIITCNNVGADKKIAFRRTGANNFSIEHDSAFLYFYNETTSNVIFKMANNNNVTFTGDVYTTGTSNSNVVISRDNMYVDAGQFYIGADDATTDDSFRQRTASGSYFIESRKSGTWTNRLQINTAGTLIGSQGATFAGTIAASGYNDSNWNTAYGWGNHASANYWVKSGSWYGDLGSNGYTRELGLGMTGGSEFVVLSKNGQGSVLVDGHYMAYESANGFFGSFDSSYGNLTGIRASAANTLKVMQLDGGNAILLVSQDVRAPIFYDSSNTVYYTDPASRSNIGDLDLNSGAVWDATTQGTGKGALHLDPNSATDHAGGAITFGASDHNNGQSADAGIYIRSDGSYGTKMYFSTTDSYAAGSKTAMNILENGQVNITRNNLIVNSDVRGTIFYDSNNTNYYVDPASTGVSLNVQGRLQTSSTGTASAPALAINCPTSSSFIHTVESITPNMTTGQANILVIGKAQSTKNAGYIGYYYDNAANNNNFVTIGQWGENHIFRVYGDVVTSQVSFRGSADVRGTIFYDSQDTAYYVNPNAGSNLAAPVTFSTNDSTLTFQDAGTNAFQMKMSAGDELYLGSNNTYQLQMTTSGNVNTQGDWRFGANFVKVGNSSTYNSDDGGWGSRFQVASTVHARIDVAQDANAMRSTWYCHSGHAGSVFGTFTAHHQYLYSHSAKRQTLFAGYSQEEASYRAPIFYDSQNTAFYTDPDGTSVFSKIWCKGSATNTAPRWDTSFHVAQSQHFYGHNSSQNLYFGESNPAIFGSTLTVAGIIDANGGHGGINLTNSSITSARVSTWTGNPGTEGKIQYHSHRWYMVSDSASDLIVQFRRNGSDVSYIDNAGRLMGAPDLRVPIYYDTNTAYYGDFAATSRMLNLDFGVAGYYLKAGDWGTRQQTPYGWIQFGPANTSHAHIYTDRSNFYFNAQIQLNGGSLINTNDIRAQVFYDVNNTNYYLDPHSTSVIVGLTMAGALQTAGSHTVGSGGTSNIYMGGTSGNYFRFHTNNSHTYFDANVGDIHWRQGASTRFTFYMTSANMTINGSLTQNSDERVKENIVEIPNAIDKIKAMKGVYYNRTDFNTGLTKVGVLAQEVEAVLPELIVEAPDSGLKSVAYGELTAVLINAIKEQQTIIDDLKTRLETLENQ